MMDNNSAVTFSTVLQAAPHQQNNINTEVWSLNHHSHHHQQQHNHLNTTTSTTNHHHHHNNQSNGNNNHHNNNGNSTTNSANPLLNHYMAAAMRWNQANQAVANVVASGGGVSSTSVNNPTAAAVAASLLASQYHQQQQHQQQQSDQLLAQSMSALSLQHGGASTNGNSCGGGGVSSTATSLLNAAANNATGCYLPSTQAKRKSQNNTSKTNLYIAGLAENVTDDTVRRLVLGVIEPKSCKALMAHGKCTGTGFIDCHNEEEAEKAKFFIEDKFCKSSGSDCDDKASLTDDNNDEVVVEKKIVSIDVINHHQSNDLPDLYAAERPALDEVVRSGRKLEVKYAFENEKDSLNVYVRNLPRTDFDAQHLKELFANYGEVTSVKLLEGQSGSGYTGAGFVRYSCPEEAQHAIISMNESNRTLEGCDSPVRCKLADKTDKRYKSSLVAAAAAAGLFHSMSTAMAANSATASLFGSSVSNNAATTTNGSQPSPLFGPTSPSSLLTQHHQQQQQQQQQQATLAALAFLSNQAMNMQNVALYQAQMAAAAAVAGAVDNSNAVAANNNAAAAAAYLMNPTAASIYQTNARDATATTYNNMNKSNFTTTANGASVLDGAGVMRSSPHVTNHNNNSIPPPPPVMVNSMGMPTTAAPLAAPHGCPSIVPYSNATLNPSSATAYWALMNQWSPYGMAANSTGLFSPHATNLVAANGFLNNSSTTPTYYAAPTAAAAGGVISDANGATIYSMPPPPAPSSHHSMEEAAAAAAAAAGMYYVPMPMASYHHHHQQHHGVTNGLHSPSTAAGTVSAAPFAANNVNAAI